MSTDDPKRYTISAAVTKAEYEDVVNRARAEGLTISNLIREALAKLGWIKGAEPETISQTVRRSVGYDINSGRGA